MAKPKLPRPIVGDKKGELTILSIENDIIQAKCSCGRRRELHFYKWNSAKHPICRFCTASLNGAKSSGCVSKDRYNPPKGFKRFRDTTIFVNEEGKTWSSSMGQLLKQRVKNDGGYIESYNHYVHRMVAEVFIPNDDPTLTQVNHKDKNPANNRVDNLEWVTPRENVMHARGVRDYKDR